VIYTIGYAKLTPGALQRLTRKLNAWLVDVRRYPRSRKPGFNHKQLEALLGHAYHWKGDVLGGFGCTTPAGLDWLEQMHIGKTLLLMCVEHAPGDCHRHQTICGPHFPRAVHIFEDELITAAALQRAEDDDTDYVVKGSLSSLLKRKRL